MGSMKSGGSLSLGPGNRPIPEIISSLDNVIIRYANQKERSSAAKLMFAREYLLWFFKREKHQIMLGNATQCISLF